MHTSPAKLSETKTGKAALLWGNIVLAFLLFFLVAHLLEGELGTDKFQSKKELVAFIMFPLAAVAGLLLALWQPLWGGLLVVAAILTTYILMPDLISNVYTGAVMMAGILYIVAARKMITEAPAG